MTSSDSQTTCQICKRDVGDDIHEIAVSNALVCSFCANLAGGVDTLNQTELSIDAINKRVMDKMDKFDEEYYAEKRKKRIEKMKREAEYAIREMFFKLKK